MLAAAFDASGHEADQPVMVVAGFISSAADWASFSKEWYKRLSKDDLPYFHMREILKWNVPESQRRALFGDLMTIIKDHAYRKFGMAIVTRLTSRISHADKLRWYLGAYSLAGRACANDVYKWVARERIPSPVACFFEEGDLGAGLLRDGMIQDGFPPPVFLPGKKPRKTQDGTIVRHFLPLQAADFIAAEYFMYVSNEIRKSGKRSNVRWGFLEFEKMAGEVYAIDNRGSESWLKLLEMSKRIDELIRQHKRGNH
jgi:hypothetical protein